MIKVVVCSFNSKSMWLRPLTECGCSVPPSDLLLPASGMEMRLSLSSSSFFSQPPDSFPFLRLIVNILSSLLLLHMPAAPPQPPAEDVDRYRRRFNMRMLVPGRPVKETPATPPPVPAERPTYREKFIPPELSMWDYFVAKVRH